MKIYTLKYFNDDDKLFYIKTLNSNGEELKCKKYDNFLSFARALHYKFDDVNFNNFKFEGIDITKYDFGGACINSNVLKNRKLYNDNFFINKMNKFSIDNICDNKLLPQLIKKELKIPTYNSYNRDNIIYYISDIHINQKLIKKFPYQATENEVRFYIKDIVNQIGMQFVDEWWSNSYLLIAGDTSFDFDISKMFFEELIKVIKPKKIIAVLGNHEIWDLHYNGLGTDNIDKIIEKYRLMLNGLNINFLNNDLMIIKNNKSIIINEKELLGLTSDEIRDMCKNSTLNVFGGIGFSALNKEYNATCGIYRNTINSLEKDILYTNKFNSVYKKVKDSLNDYKIICLTHMPKDNWSSDDYIPEWIYVNGHTHKNYCVESNQKTIYADNQIGYFNEKINLNYFDTSMNYDIFKNYNDGIYNIKKEDYRKYYHGLNIPMTFNGKGKVFMLKKESIYCFLLKNNNKIYLLDGGNIRNVEKQDIDYYYNNIQAYSNIIKCFLNDLHHTLNQISQQVKLIGGSGIIHGCIVDIDMFNHIYYDFREKTIKPYFALDSTKRLVYDNVISLIYTKCNELYNNFQKAIINNKNKLSTLYSIYNDKINENGRMETINIYRESIIIKKLQYSTNYNIIRKWDERVLDLGRNYKNEEILKLLNNF